MITPCPILETAVELRFESSLPSEAVFGIIYNQFKDVYETVEKLPILQLPEQIRMTDANLKYKPYYKLAKDNIVLTIGPKVISIGCINNYIGWDEFSEVINTHIKKVLRTKAINKITRYGIRYINFFSTDIFNNIKLQVKADDFPYKLKEPFIKTFIYHNKYTILLQLASNASILKDSKQHKGSVLDLDVSLSNPKYDIKHKIHDIVAESHEVERSIFFNLLTKEFLDTLNPQY